MDKAVIFDCDGVLLDLMRDEEEMFFEALAAFVPAQELSRDWNSYEIRNDEDIIAEVLSRFGRPLACRPSVVAHYLQSLHAALAARRIVSSPIPGIEELLQALKGEHVLGLATANLLAAARLRLSQVGLWSYVSALAVGADGGGHKRQLLARLLEAVPLPASRIVYVGDNVVDVEAGQSNGVHMIGFSVEAGRRDQLHAAGACHIASSHAETAALIEQILPS